MKHFLRAAAAVVILACASPVAAQTVDPCAPVPPPPDALWTGRAPTLTWQMQATVPVSATDPTLVPQRIDGFYLAVDGAIGAARVDTGKLIPVTCPNGLIGFKYLMPSGFAKGSHTVATSGYNFTLDAAGLPTTTRQEGLVTSRPFVVTDPVQSGPPQAPIGSHLWR